METILKMKDICKGFPGVIALKDMQLRLERGSIMALMGENGAGKSTLIKVLSGALRPDGGKIILDGGTYGHMTPQKSIAAGISVIYQELNLVPQLSIYENIFLGKEDAKVFLNKALMVQKAEQIMASLGISLPPKAIVKNLSVGFRQLVEVAKAIAQNAKILVLDEPTSSLSNAEVARLFGILKALQQKGVSMIYISHRLEEVFELCDCVTVMRDGEFVGQEKIESLDRDKLIRMMVGRELKETWPQSSAAAGEEPVLQVRNLSAGPIRNLSFELNKGEILGFAGLVGAGRTEMARALYGADKSETGDVFIGSQRVGIAHPLDAIKAGIGLVPEDRKGQGLNLKGGIDSNIALANLDATRGSLLLSNKKEQALVMEYVRYLSIKTPSLKKKVVELSGGNQQKVVLAKWLARRCKILILDEPTRGIDVRSKQEIYKLMRELSQQGISIIMISSEMPELIGMADRIAVMHDYRIAAILSKEEFSQERILTYASGGTPHD